MLALAGCKGLESRPQPVKQSSEDNLQVALVMFSTQNCPPCKKAKPRFDLLSDTYPGVFIYSTNRELAKENRVRRFPTFVAYDKETKELWRTNSITEVENRLEEIWGEQ